MTKDKVKWIVEKKEVHTNNKVTKKDQSEGERTKRS